MGTMKSRNRGKVGLASENLTVLTWQGVCLCIVGGIETIERPFEGFHAAAKKGGRSDPSRMPINATGLSTRFTSVARGGVTSAELFLSLFFPSGKWAQGRKRVK